MPERFRLTEDNRKWWTLGAMCFALFMIMLDNTVVNVALPSIQRSLHTTLSSLEWTVNAYTLTFAVLLVTGGRLGDIFGRRRMFLFGVVVFALSSAAIGLAPTQHWLVAGRALQGVGGAFMMPGTLSIISNTFEPHERGRAIGTWAGVSALALALGPAVGGALTEYVSWRAIFFLNLPVAAGAVIVTLFAARESFDRTVERRVDYPGIAAISIGLTALVLALVEGNSWGWGSAAIVSLLATAAAADDLRPRRGGRRGVPHVASRRRHHVRAAPAVVHADGPRHGVHDVADVHGGDERGERRQGGRGVGDPVDEPHGGRNVRRRRDRRAVPARRHEPDRLRPRRHRPYRRAALPGGRRDGLGAGRAGREELRPAHRRAGRVRDEGRVRARALRSAHAVCRRRLPRRRAGVHADRVEASAWRTGTRRRRALRSRSGTARRIGPATPAPAANPPLAASSGLAVLAYGFDPASLRWSVFARRPRGRAALRSPGFRPAEGPRPNGR